MARYKIQNGQGDGQRPSAADHDQRSHGKNHFTNDLDGDDGHRHSSGSGHDRDDKKGLGLGHFREDDRGDNGWHGQKGKDKKEESEDDNCPTKPEAGNADGAVPPEGEETCSADNLFVIGTDASEAIVGACGNDELYGARGDDVIYGGAGSDYLSGNWGRDFLIGGAGADVFAFDGDFDRDEVLDFSIGDGDRLEFVFYAPDQIFWSAEDLVTYLMQDGADTVLTLPGSDEAVVLRNTDLADVTTDVIDVRMIDMGADLMG